MLECLGICPRPALGNCPEHTARLLEHGSRNMMKIIITTVIIIIIVNVFLNNTKFKSNRNEQNPILCVMSRIGFLQNRCVEALSPNTSECGFVWK